MSRASNVIQLAHYRPFSAQELAHAVSLGLGQAALPANTRRASLGRAAAATAVSGIALSAIAAPASADVADTDLIRRCYQFAECQLASWYRYVTAPVDKADEQDTPHDWETLHWITATPATTPAGWHAKALAYTAWNHDAYNDPKEDADSTTPLLAALLRDMVAPARNAIMARLATQYGPLGAEYTAEGIWLGWGTEG
jgi:hypothetical protein